MLPASAFIGASLGSRLFTRRWVRHAFQQALSEHQRLLVVVADELWLYTRAFNEDGHFVLNLEEAQRRMQVIRQEMVRLFEACRDQLLASDANRIEIASWSTYSDAKYAHLLRSLRCAAAYLPSFAASVESAAIHHVSAIPDQASDLSSLRAASKDYVLDEIAMCLRITELSEFSVEYYPGEDLSVLRELYADQFEKEGLDIEGLVGKARQRVFTNLGLPEDEE